MPTLPKIKRRSAVEVFRNRYGALHNDQVYGPGGTPGRYLRWKWAKEGVVAIPCHRNTVALTNNFRYPVGRESLEFPRGSRKPAESMEAAAERELQEETGLVPTSVKILGSIFSDTGLISNTLPVVLVNVLSRQQGQRRPEAMESIDPVLEWLNSREIDSYVRDNRIQCGITLAALFLLRSSGLLP